MADQILHTSPIGPLLSMHQLLNARVIYRFFRDPALAHDVRTGIVKEIKHSKHFGWMVRIDVDPGQGDEMPVSWYSMSAVMGWAWYTDPEETAVAVPVVVPVMQASRQWTPVYVRMFTAFASLVGVTA